VSVGNNTDVVIKLMNVETKKCIRYVYIQGNNSFTIKNIPEGRYYLKIAYGRFWKQKEVKGKCLGKFSNSALYKKGEKILDFNKIYTGIKTVGEDRYRTFQLPSFSLRLDVVTTNFDDQYKSNSISEDDFNDQE
jgi:hypothetical protein